MKEYIVILIAFALGAIFTGLAYESGNKVLEYQQQEPIRETIENHSFSTIVWDTSTNPWKQMPNCALVTQKQVKEGVWCDNFSKENWLNIRFIEE